MEHDYSNATEVATTSATLDYYLKKNVKSIPQGKPRRNPLYGNAGISSLYGFSDILAQLRTELEFRKREEEKLQKEINEILSESTVGGEQSRAFGIAVSRLNNSMLVVESDAKQLAASLTTISRLADSISGKVSSLDSAKTRVVECLQLSSDMRDLGVCSEGVDDAILHEDFEQAAEHIHRFLTLDQAVFQLKDGLDKEAGQSVLHSYDVLTQAATRLKDILEKKLDDAILSEDIPAMQRFIKLFPLLNAHDSGLLRFAKYLGSQIEKIGEDKIKIMGAGGTDDSRMNVLYADTLFLFFEGAAGLLETNQPVIENSYGPDKLLDFISTLQEYVDRMSSKILDAFSKKRQIARLAKHAGKVLRDSKNPRPTSQERINPLELDTLLSELCLLNTHSEMYWRFVKRRIHSDRKDQKNEFEIVSPDIDMMDEDSIKKLKIEQQRKREERARKLDLLLNRSALGTRIQELLGQYILLEQYFMEESVLKAIELDIREDGLLSSVVDDVLFIVRKCIRRAASSGSVDCVCAALNNGCTLLETSFVQYLESSLNAGFPSGGFAAEAFQTAQTAYNVLQHGKTVTESGSEAQKENFLTASNNARGASEMVLGLKETLRSDLLKKERAPIDSGKLEHSLSQLDETALKLSSLASKAMESLCVTAFRSKIKTSCEIYLDLPHCLSEAQFYDYEAVDPFIETFNTNIDKSVVVFEPLLLAENYQALLLSVCTEVSKQIERVIFKCSFNRMGGLQLDKEFRHLSAYLSGIAGWSAREKSNRLAQIVSLLNVESVEEAVELWETSKTSSLFRSLSPVDVKKTLLLRSDLPEQVIVQLQL